MKRIIILLFFLAAKIGSAQDIAPITFGPMISMTSTTLKSNPDFKDQISGSGYNFGAFARLKLKFIYAQGELSFGTKSASVSADTNNVTFKLNGIDAVAVIGAKVLSIGNYGNARIFFGYNWDNFFDISYSVDGSDLSTSNVNTNNHNILFGIGADFSRLTLDIKYIKGLSDLTVSTNNKVEMRVVNISLGLKIL